jgi:hypothetical protein
MRRTVSNGRMVKGIGPIAIAIVLMVGVLVTEGVFVANFIKDEEVVKRSAREVGITAAVNFVEFAKRAHQQAVSYSFYAAANDVLENGGYCAYDNVQCGGTCKIPEPVNTRNCKPWWLIYGNSYAPEYTEFLSYLAGRVSDLYNDYSALFLGPQYCPMPPGDVKVESNAKYDVQVNITNTAGGVLRYNPPQAGLYATESLDISERNVLFTDRINSAALEIFNVAKKLLGGAGTDAVAEAFETADSSMPAECKKISLGDICLSDVACEEELKAHCPNADNTYKTAARSSLENSYDDGCCRVLENRPQIERRIQCCMDRQLAGHRYWFPGRRRYCNKMRGDKRKGVRLR